jgi:shikimate kinase
MNSPIFLMGFMSSGKSRLGKKLAKKLEIPFIDLDKEIETKEGKSISQIFEERGEEGFRKLEAKYLKQLPLKVASIIALGGGTPVYENNLAFILENGTSIYLKVEPKYLIGRLKEKSAKRPLVSDLNEKELSDFVTTTLKLREPYYEQASFVLASNKPTSSEIINLIKA